MDLLLNLRNISIVRKSFSSTLYHRMIIEVIPNILSDKRQGLGGDADKYDQDKVIDLSSWKN